MKKSFGNANIDLHDYAIETFHPEDAILKEVRERTIKEGLPPIQIGKMDALHLEVITRSISAIKAVEIGTLGGYSGIAIARGLQDSGKLYTFELEPRNAKVSTTSFKKADVSHKVEVFTGEALKNLSKIEKHGPFDLVFMDADKGGYVHYLDWAALHLRVGGIVLADNTFGWNLVASYKHGVSEKNLDVYALQKFNKKIATHPQFRTTILPTGEGLTFGVKIA